MINKIDKNEIRAKRHRRVRANISGTAECPRLCVYRSLSHIYAQIIDDTVGNTLASASSMDKALAEQLKGKSKKEVARLVGEQLAVNAKAKKIKKVVFDRGGYVYTGRVKELADGARSKGLEF